MFNERELWILKACIINMQNNISLKRLLIEKGAVVELDRELCELNNKVYSLWYKINKGEE